MTIREIDSYILAVYHSLGIIGWIVFMWAARKFVKHFTE